MAEYIEKQAALDIVNGWRDELIPTYGENDEYVKCLETVAEHLELLHAADVRPVRRGLWGLDSRGMYSCSCCGQSAPYYVQADIIEYWPNLNYCPNCGSYNGADMRGGDADGGKH